MPSTGYRWTEDAQISDTAVLVQTGHLAIASPTAGPGSAGTEMWTFSADPRVAATITHHLRSAVAGRREGRMDIHGRSDGALVQIVGFAEEPFRVVEVVGGAGEWELRGGIPLGSAVESLRVFQPLPSSFVVLGAGEGELCRCRWVRLGPVVDVVDFGTGGRDVTARVGAPLSLAYSTIR